MRENAFSEPQQVKCKGCPTLFAPKSTWQEFHSDACRTAFHRKQRMGPEGQMAEIGRQVEELKKETKALNDRVAILEKRPA